MTSGADRQLALVLPVLVLASQMTASLLAGGEVSSALWSWLALYDLTFVGIAYFVFDYILEE